MKLIICTSMLLLTGITLSIAGTPAAFTHPAPLPPGTVCLSDGIPPTAFDDFGGKKKKKKKKKSGHDLFQQGGGISMLLALSNAAEVDNHAIGFALCYFPSLRVARLGDHALRFGFSPSIYTNFKFNAREGISSSVREGGGIASFILDLPAALELHLGDPSSGAGFGGHVGAGFSYNRMSSDGAPVNAAFGPYFTGGVRFNTLGSTMGLRAGFLLNVSHKPDAYGHNPKHVFSLAYSYYF